MTGAVVSSVRERAAHMAEKLRSCEAFLDGAEHDVLEGRSRARRHPVKAPRELRLSCARFTFDEDRGVPGACEAGGL